MATLVTMVVSIIKCVCLFVPGVYVIKIIIIIKLSICE